MNSKIGFDPSMNPSSISEVVGPIDRRLIDILSIERNKWVEVDETLAAPFDALQSLIFSGGKEYGQHFSIGHMLAQVVMVYQK